MENTELILWVMSAGFGINFALIGLVWHNSNVRTDKLENKLEGMNTKLSDLDKRLYAIETVLRMKECCILQTDQNVKKAE